MPELDDVLLATHSAVESAKVCHAGPSLKYRSEWGNNEYKQINVIEQHGGA